MKLKQTNDVEWKRQNFLLVEQNYLTLFDLLITNLSFTTFFASIVDSSDVSIIAKHLNTITIMVKFMIFIKFQNV